MAATYQLSGVGIGFAANKCMLGVFNTSGSGKVVRVYRIWTINNQITPVTGSLTNLEIRKITAASGGTTLIPVPNDPSSPILTGVGGTSGQITCGTNMTVTLTDLYRRIMWSTDEPSNPAGTTAFSVDELQTFLPFCTLWSMGYADPNSEPITLREGEGCAVINTGAFSGQSDFFFEMTVV